MATRPAPTKAADTLEAEGPTGPSPVASVGMGTGACEVGTMLDVRVLKLLAALEVMVLTL